MEILGRRYDNGAPARLRWEGDRLAACQSVEPSSVPPDLPWVAPGLIDIQVNGFQGQEFSSLELTPEKVAEIVRAHHPLGVTRLCPTLTTQSFEVLAHGMQAIHRACEASAEIGCAVAGIHLEGPYIATEDGPRGAHPRQHCRPPDWEEFQRLQEAAGGRIVLLTLSPEYEGSAEFIRRVVSSGVVVAIAHTAASSDQIRAAVDAGASLSTHLGNGAHGTLRRHPNYIWTQLAEDRLMASLIVDGHHLPPEVVQCFVRGKTPARCILVSDESGLAGLPPGRYPSSGGDVEILDDGRLVIAGQRQLLAGASRPLSAGVANVMRFAGVDLATAIEMATAHPARLLGLECGRLRPGDRADLIVFDLPAAATCNGSADLNLRATISAGRFVHGAA